MSDLSLQLDDIDFERLAALGQSLIPSLTPRWTDHNVHDPGIMLNELLAWTADAQIYALGRMRRDERRAYGQLLGIGPKGPEPARGYVWPFDPAGHSGVPFVSGTVLDATCSVKSDDPMAPTSYLTHPIELTAAELIGVSSRLSDGSSPQDFTQVNAQQGTSYLPFGETTAPNDKLVLTLRGALVATSSSGGLLSIGFDLVPDMTPGAVSGVTTVACDLPRELRVAVEDSGGERPLELVADTTCGLLQSGVLLLRVGTDSRPYDSTFSLTIRSLRGALLRAPRLRRVSPNVLPIVQIEPVQEIVGLFGTGLPDQRYQLTRQGLVFSEGQSAMVVEVANHDTYEPWNIDTGFAQAGPADRTCVLELETGEVMFGNGVNGCVVPAGATLRVTYQVSTGSRGMLPRGIVWKVKGMAEPFGTNAQATFGGANARVLEDVRALARRGVQTARPLITAEDLESEALSYADLGVARAKELTRQQPACMVRGTRSLVVLGPVRNIAAPSEPRDWLAEIRTRLMRGLPLGQRLEVMSPRIATIRVRARVMAAPNLDPDVVSAGISDVLNERFALVASNNAGWPLGRSVALMTLKGWIRNTDGVSRVLELAVTADGRKPENGVLNLGPIGLPRLELANGDVVVERFVRGGLR